MPADPMGEARANPARHRLACQLDGTDVSGPYKWNFW
jgi:hypothetical protein